MKQLAYHKILKQAAELMTASKSQLPEIPPQKQRPFCWDHDIQALCNHMKLTEIYVNHILQPEPYEICKYCAIIFPKFLVRKSQWPSQVISGIPPPGHSRPNCRAPLVLDTTGYKHTWRGQM